MRQLTPHKTTIWVYPKKSLPISQMSILSQLWCFGQSDDRTFGIHIHHEYQRPNTEVVLKSL